MRALHLFPRYGSELVDGSDHSQRMLTRALARRGVEIEVLTTCSARTLAHGAVGLGWPSDYPPGATSVDGVAVRRFRAYSPAPLWARALSLPMVERWRREETRDGVLVPGSDDAVEAYRRRALSRPPAYDYLALAGRGPHSRALWQEALAAARRADVVLAGFTPFATLWYAVRVAERAGKPLVLLPLFHPEDARHHFRIHYDCFARADALLAETAYGAELFPRLSPGCRPVEIGLGVDPEELAGESVDGARFRRRHGLGDEKIVLVVGRKEEHKRYEVAVEAVERLADDRVRLVLIGADVDRRPLDAARVRYLGPLPRAELLDAYDACDVFVLPSERESFGLVFLEAWMRRKPVIGSALCRPVGSLIAAGRDGLLACDAGELAGQIASLLADPERARRMGEAGYAKVMRRYTWDRIGDALFSLYEELCRSGRRRRDPIGRS